MDYIEEQKQKASNPNRMPIDMPVYTIAYFPTGPVIYASGSAMLASDPKIIKTQPLPKPRRGQERAFDIDE